MSDKCYKALNFDLDTNSLKRYYPGSNYRQAYRDIKTFLVQNGFQHRQWSGYKSIEPLSDYKITYIAIELDKRFPWLAKCVNRFDVTDIGKQYDMAKIIKSAHTKEPLSRNEQDKPRRSIKSRLEDAKVRANAHNAQLRERSPVREPKRYTPER